MVARGHVKGQHHHSCPRSFILRPAFTPRAKRFNGQYDDTTLGYLYLRARWYDPQTGRFLSKDPFPGVLTNPASQRQRSSRSLETYH